MNTMFRVENNVPDVYPQYSRDFQLLARLFDIAFQSVRFSIDSMENISDTKYCNSNILPLLDSKLGFHSNLDLSDRTHRKILDAFPYIIKYKGSFEGVQRVLNLFKRITTVDAEYIWNATDQEITIVLYDYFYHLDILLELINYVKPTGVLVKFIKRVKITSGINAELRDEARIGTTMNYLDTTKNEESGVVIKELITGSSAENYDANIASNIGFTQISRATDSETESELLSNEESKENE